nr:hypothetical protein [Bacillus subtilis]
MSFVFGALGALLMVSVRENFSFTVTLIVLVVVIIVAFILDELWKRHKKKREEDQSSSLFFLCLCPLWGSVRKMRIYNVKLFLGNKNLLLQL